MLRIDQLTFTRFLVAVALFVMHSDYAQADASQCSVTAVDPWQMLIENHDITVDGLSLYLFLFG